MKRFLVQNKEVFVVTYIVEGENIDDAFNNWADDKGRKIDMDYQADLRDYTRHAVADIQEIEEEE